MQSIILRDMMECITLLLSSTPVLHSIILHQMMECITLLLSSTPVLHSIILRQMMECFTLFASVHSGGAIRNIGIIRWIAPTPLAVLEQSATLV
ncbi:hypothetical protein L596_000017 [Steinernema carpocapsae]|uniref:Uncharacterized protein n=1 Tax=Steinernema carpocapsae TaxID=34508 RepID=A0A4U8UGM6_STECR|nr:hypothetical protein L596_000017 [Steinernema carpocapsae]